MKPASRFSVAPSAAAPEKEPEPLFRLVGGVLHRVLPGGELQPVVSGTETASEAWALSPIAGAVVQKAAEIRLASSPRIVALDLGVECGWAVHQDSEVVISGTWRLDLGGGGAGGRYLRFRQEVAALLDKEPTKLLAYEKVRRHEGTFAAHVYGAFEAEVFVAAHQRKLVVKSLEVSHVKKLATGNGNASKALMLAAARTRWPNATIVDDNEADARWIAVAATTSLARRAG